MIEANCHDPPPPRPKWSFMNALLLLLFPRIPDPFTPPSPDMCWPRLLRSSWSSVLIFFCIQCPEGQRDAPRGQSTIGRLLITIAHYIHVFLFRLPLQYAQSLRVCAVNENHFWLRENGTLCSQDLSDRIRSFRFRFPAAFRGGKFDSKKVFKKFPPSYTRPLSLAQWFICGLWM